jgi:hypothetical protein
MPKWKIKTLRKKINKTGTDVIIKKIFSPEN